MNQAVIDTVRGSVPAYMGDRAAQAMKDIAAGKQRTITHEVSNALIQSGFIAKDATSVTGFRVLADGDRNVIL